MVEVFIHQVNLKNLIVFSGSRTIKRWEQRSTEMDTEVRLGVEEEEREGVEDVQGDVWKRLQTGGLGVKYG